MLVERRIEALRSSGQIVSPTSRAAGAGTRARAAAAADAAATIDSDLPGYVTFALARWRLLNDVPFRYLVPDTRLMPDESIRFFTLDPDWLDALTSGALIAGGGGTREIAQAQSAVAGSRVAALKRQAFVRDVMRGRLTLSTLPILETVSPTANSPETVSGFLLHSALVSAWPGLQVRAWASDDPADVPADVDPSVLANARPELVVPVLRMERLSPAVLIVLFAGVPRLLWLEEPHHGVQYGVDAAATGFRLAIRDESGHETTATVAVPMRAGSVAGVIDVSALATAIDAARPLPHPRGSAGLALALLKAPARQRFSKRAGGGPA